jgi:phosphatidylglycerophosphatase A
LYSGLFPLWPGTAGSIPPLAIAYFFIGDNWMLMAAVSVVATFISAYAAGAAETFMGHDSRKIVIDEWAGMFITLILVPLSITNYLIAFFWFRLFDVIKLPPASQAEKLPGGWGVTMDDVVAGIQANILTHVTLYVIRMMQ